MTKKTIYTNEPLGKIEAIKDFLPPPSELAFREEGDKAALALSNIGVDFLQTRGIKVPDKQP